MKPVNNIVLLHGYAENPTKVWFPWLHGLVEDRGVRVWAPALPDTLRPNYKKWLNFASRAAAGWDESTVVIGNSIGGVLALRALEKKARRPVRALITLGSPFTATVSVQAYIDFFKEKIDWEKLRRSAGKFITIHSKNDPLVPYDHAQRYREILGSKLIMTAGDGHFNTKEVPVLAQELEKLLPKK